MRRRLWTSGGFTLVEMVVVMAVFVVVLMITSAAFQTVLKKGSIVQKSEESNIEGIIGLEMLRHDLAQAGFGLFNDPDAVPTFAEAGAVPASNYNDANAVPRAIVTGNDLAADVLPGTDYLAIKATTVGRNQTSQLWTYLPDDGAPHLWGVNDFENARDDQLIVLSQTYKKSQLEVLRTLVQISPTNYAIVYDSAGNFEDMTGTVTTGYTPSTGKTHYLYGVGTGAAPFALRAPFNRADYYVRRIAGEIPAMCSPATGVLYKAVMSQANGLMTPTIPILDCVADMQIILGWNTQADPEISNTIDAFSNADGTTTTGATNGLNIANIMQDPAQVRKRLRQIKIYILAQDGPRDPDFRNTNNAFVIGDVALGEAPLTARAAPLPVSPVDLTTADMLNYRWKLHRVVVRPKNLM